MNLVLINKERLNEEVKNKIFKLTEGKTPLVDNALTCNEIFIYFDAKKLLASGVFENFIISNSSDGLSGVDYVLELDKFKKSNNQIEVPFGNLFDKIIVIDLFSFEQERLNVNGFTQISNEVIHKLINSWVEFSVMCTTYSKI